MIPAIFGCLFGVLGIFTVGIIFVPLAGLCALVGLVGSLSNRDSGAVFMSIVAGILTLIGFATSPSIWLLTAAVVGSTGH